MMVARALICVPGRRRYVVRAPSIFVDRVAECKRDDLRWSGMNMDCITFATLICAYIIYLHKGRDRIILCSWRDCVYTGIHQIFAAHTQYISVVRTFSCVCVFFFVVCARWFLCRFYKMRAPGPTQLIATMWKYYPLHFVCILILFLHFFHLKKITNESIYYIFAPSRRYSTRCTSTSLGFIWCAPTTFWSCRTRRFARTCSRKRSSSPSLHIKTKRYVCWRAYK